MSRVQLALRVADLEGSIEFYSRLFGTEPAKRRPGYVNFAVVDPPLKLVLLEGGPAEGGTHLDHLGVEVERPEQVADAARRLGTAGLATRREEATSCCYAVQDKVWVTGPGDEPWEVYAVTGDVRPDLEGSTDLARSVVAGDGTCCRRDGDDGPAVSDGPAEPESESAGPEHADPRAAHRERAAACC